MLYFTEGFIILNSQVLSLYVSFPLESPIQFTETPFTPLPLTTSIIQATEKALRLFPDHLSQQLPGYRVSLHHLAEGETGHGEGAVPGHTPGSSHQEKVHRCCCYTGLGSNFSARPSALKSLSCLGFNFLICKMGNSPT